MPFDADKLLVGLRHACYKRPISSVTLQKVVEFIEDELCKRFDREVPSHIIGSLAAMKLRELDHVAYVRFASIYRDFNNLDDMMMEIESVKASVADSVPGQQSLFE
jgi:transcriptional repressor NrdR